MTSGGEQPAEPIDIADAICRSISAAIVDGHLKPGTKLPEAAIGVHFGVSRTIVRSAMNRLQRERLVEMRKNHGVFVATPTREEARQLYDVRRVIEQAVVERLSDKLTQRDITELIQHTRREDEVHRQGAREDAVRLSGAFHLRLAALTGNAVLLDILDLLVRRSALVIAAYGPKHGSSCGANDHRDLIHALERRDGGAVQATMDRHLREIEASLALTVPPDRPATVIEILSRYSGA